MVNIRYQKSGDIRYQILDTRYQIPDSRFQIFWLNSMFVPTVDLRKVCTMEAIPCSDFSKNWRVYPEKYFQHIYGSVFGYLLLIARSLCFRVHFAPCAGLCAWMPPNISAPCSKITAPFHLHVVHTVCAAHAQWRDV